MASTRIPPELFDNILAYGRDERDPIREYIYTGARQETLRYLLTCSSVCLYWANFIRPRIFQILVLRSAKDLYGLLALLRRPCSTRIRSIEHCLRTVAVFYRFEDFFWCHDLQRLQTRVHEEFDLRIHISGQAPSVFIRGGRRTVRHPLFHSIPRIVPFHRQLLRYVDLIIEDVFFPDGTGLFKLMHDIGYSGILLRSVLFDRVQWGDNLTLPLGSLEPTSLNRRPPIEPFDVTITQCTDNFLAGFAMHKYIGRRGRGIVALNSSDADRFLDTFSEWVHLARKARLGRFPITYQVFLPGGPLGREGGILLSEADRDIDMAGYLWRLSRYRLGDFLNPLENLMEFGYYTRLGQSQDLRGAHTAPVSSIVITLYDITIPMNWITLLRKALGFPMSTIEVRVHGWDRFRSFVSNHREILAVVELQGRLRLYFSNVRLHMFEDEHWQRQDFSGTIDSIGPRNSILFLDDKDTPANTDLEPLEPM